jgi:type IV secretory pathway VirB3-like protein
MSADPTTATKLCTVCGIDCAGKPRIKDQQGRYICKECFDKAKQTRQTQKSPPPAAGAPTATVAVPADGDNSFLLAMGSKESTGTAGTKPCPECGRAMPTNAIICVGCGFNTSTGKRLSVKVLKAKKEKGSNDSARASGGGSGFFDNGPLLGVIVFLIHAASGAVLFIEPSLGLAMMGVSVLVSLIIWISTIVAALRENSVWGLMCIIPLLAAVWGLFLTEDPRFRAIWSGHVLGNIARFVIMYMIASK